MTEPSAELLDAIKEVTAVSLGSKIGVKVLGSLFASPLTFFIHKGLEDLFGSPDAAEFKKVFEKLNQLDREIRNAVNQITLAIEQSQLESQHTNIEVHYGNLSSVIRHQADSAKIDDVYLEAYSSYFTEDTAGVLNDIKTDIDIIDDNLLGKGAISKPFFSLQAQNLYHANADIRTFNASIRDLGLFYLNDLIQATLVLVCIQQNAGDENYTNRAADHISTIHGYSNNISATVNQFLRSIPDLAQALENHNQFMIVNRATSNVLARYYKIEFKNYENYGKFELKPHGDGYFYLKLAGRDLGIDHYYGKRIKPVFKSDSGHPNHLWKFVPSENDPGRWFRIRNKATGAILDHYYGRSIKTAPLDEHPNHLWEVLPDKEGNQVCIINRATNDLLGYNDDNIDTFKGRYTIDVGHHNTSLPLPGGWSNAHWTIRHFEQQGYFNLVNQLSGEALDHYRGESFRFVPSPSGHPNHLWRIEPTLVDSQIPYFFFRNKASGQVLDHYYGKSLAGASDSNAEGPHPNHIWPGEEGSGQDN